MTSEEIRNYCEEALTISKQQGTQIQQGTKKSNVFGSALYYSYIFQEVNTILTALDLQGNILLKAII